MNWTVWGMPANNDDELVASMAWLLRTRRQSAAGVLMGLRVYAEKTRRWKPRNRENPR